MVLCSDQYSPACRDVAWLCLVKASGALCWGAADVLQVSLTAVQSLQQQAQIVNTAITPLAAGYAHAARMTWHQPATKAL